MALPRPVFPPVHPPGGAFFRRNQQMISGLKAVGLLLIILPLLLLIVGLLSSGGDSAERLEWFISGGVALLVIIILRMRLRLDWFSPTIAYLGIFWMFHFGLVFPSSVVIAILDEQPKWATDWLFTPDAALAVRLSLLFQACVALGAWAVIKVRRSAPNIQEGVGAAEFVGIGWCVVTIGLIITTISLLNLGYSVYFQPYEEFFTVQNTLSLAVVVTGLGVALLLVGSQQPTSTLRIAAAVYLPVALPLLLAGSRTAPMFATVVLMVVLGRKGVKVGGWKIWVAALLVLALTATIKETREEGVGRLVQAIRLSEIESPLSGLTELGGSLRPVAATIDYMQREPYFLGETYAYPFYRQLLKALRIDLEPLQFDKRLIATQVNLVYGSIGYSTVAEAYANGGAAGVIVFALLWGAVLGGFESRWRGPYGQAALAVVLIPMMVNIRNSFIYVPAWIFVGMLPVVFAKILTKTRVGRLIAHIEGSESA